MGSILFLKRWTNFIILQVLCNFRAIKVEVHKIPTIPNGFKLCGIPIPSNSRNGIDIDFDSKIELEPILDNKIH